MTATPNQVDRLLDAIDLLNADNRESARGLLRDLIREDSNFEDAWLWMSVAVDTMDQAVVCLENALRVNPKNPRAVEALLRLRAPDMAITKRRDSLKELRDLTTGLFWMFFFGTLCASVATYMAVLQAARGG